MCKRFIDIIQNKNLKINHIALNGFESMYRFDNAVYKVSFCVVDGWEHAMVAPCLGKKTPSWEVMASVKDIFWNEEECAIQYHPPRSVYVNNHKTMLHIWNQRGNQIPSIQMVQGSENNMSDDWTKLYFKPAQSILWNLNSNTNELEPYEKYDGFNNGLLFKNTLGKMLRLKYLETMIDDFDNPEISIDEILKMLEKVMDNTHTIPELLEILEGFENNILSD